LLRTLAGALPTIDGNYKISPDIQVAYYAQHVPDELDGREQVWDYLRRQAPIDIMSEEVMRMAGNFLFTEDDYDKSISVLSGGERARLCLAGLLLTRSNLLILDEPTNHLDFETVESLALALADFTGTILLVSHNRTFVNAIATMILEVGGGQVRPYPGTYEEYVYHLEQTLTEEALPKTTPVVSKSSIDTVAPKDPDRQKDDRKRLKKVEKELAIWEKTKNKLLKKQQSNFSQFSREDYAALGEAVERVEALEEEWMGLAGR
jgi:ATP-binding cassette subfamily F protein 3